MSTFQVENGRGNVVLSTDDWVEACTAALTTNWPRGQERRVRGTHPTHSWGPPRPGQGSPDRRCTGCDGWDNGSYGSQAPCGYDFGGGSLVSALWRETAQRRAASGERQA